MDVQLTRNGEYVNTIVVESIAEAAAAYPDCECFDVTAGAPVPDAPRTISLMAFRKRCTAAERVAFDNADRNPAFPAEVQEAFRTAQADLAACAVAGVNLDDADLALGMQLAVAVGIFTAERVAEVLS